MRRLLGAAVVLAAAAVGGLGMPADATLAAAELNVTRSYYIANADRTAARNLGCSNGDTRGRMTLFFGAPREVNGTFGTTLWGAPDQTTSYIAEIVKEFARGYDKCRTSDAHQLGRPISPERRAIGRRPSQRRPRPTVERVRSR
jgi:hypothetical protein